MPLINRLRELDSSEPREPDSSISSEELRQLEGAYDLVWGSVPTTSDTEIASLYEDAKVAVGPQ